ncbi:hypothetical protein Bca52824_017382 [Brassica carinata]|uniref:Uncharacterized protein n=1 Tax=Brassica carinata TaxID=52824 RepID=A0A8X8AW68_BRACI|nr:hypothetical protein Bca52824_017382 [Brassica carinata]
MDCDGDDLFGQDLMELEEGALQSAPVADTIELPKKERARGSYSATGDPVAEAKNRRSLGNIGNIASFPGVEAGKLNLPLTCNFRAHLLENANKKQINVTKRPEAVQKKARAVVKPQPSSLTK